MFLFHFIFFCFFIKCLVEEAMKLFNAFIYLWLFWLQAYYGGEARCDEQVGAVDDYDPTELVCGACSDVSRAQVWTQFLFRNHNYISSFKLSSSFYHILQPFSLKFYFFFFNLDEKLEIFQHISVTFHLLKLQFRVLIYASPRHRQRKKKMSV